MTRSASPGFRAAIDYGPLLAFFLVTFLAPAEPLLRFASSLVALPATGTHAEALLIARVMVATAVFVVATLAAMIASHLRLGRISPMLWISGALVVVFGGLTLWFRDPHFIKMKPTFVYAILAGVLFFGLVTRRPLLQLLLGSAYPGLTERGWTLLTRNWVLFFLAMAALNELVWRGTEATMAPEAAFRAWTLYKMPGCVILTLVFALANLPLLMRHGLTLGEPEAPVPPEG